MDLGQEMIPAKVDKVYNSLIIDAALPDKRVVPVFCGASETVGLCAHGTAVWLRQTPSRLRKIKFELMFISRAEGLIFVNPSYNRALFREAFNAGILNDFSEYRYCRPIDPDDHLFHVDFELSDESGAKCYVFIKNIYLKQGGNAVFPSSMNFFEFEMFEEMSRLRNAGHRTAVFMLVPRNDCREAHFSWKFDPVASAKLFDEAKNGLDFVCYGCNLDKKSVSIAHNMKIVY